MTSTIKLYAQCGIEKNKLFDVDDIEDYLSTLSTRVVSENFQYVRQGLHVSIKIDANQATLDPDSATNYNYCSIQNGTEKVYYYFIDNKKQIAENTILLSLSLDSLNTFKMNDDFYITDKTMINRMHKDRFIIKDASSSTFTYVISGEATTIPVSAVLSRYTHNELDPKFVGYEVESYNVIINNVAVGLVSADIDDDFLSLVFQNSGGSQTFSYKVTLVLKGTRRMLRKIDKQSEGLSPILYGKNIGQLINDDEETPNHAYLIYKGQSTIKALVAFDTPTKVTVSGDKTLLPADFNVNQYYYFLPNSSLPFTSYYLEDDNGNKYHVGYRYSFGQTFTQGVVIRVSSGVIYIGTIEFYPDMSVYQYGTSTPQITSNALKVLPALYTSSIRAFVLASWTTDDDVIRGATSANFPITTSVNTIKSISALDRTDTTLVKIIKLPYSPVDLLDASASWGYDSESGFLEYKNLDERLISKIISSYSIDRNPLTDLVYDEEADGDPISIYDIKNAYNESKLFHSDYYQPKFVYDSFSKVFALERINLDSYDLYPETPFEFNFVASNTISSKFIFSFPQYKTDGYMMEDYDDIVAVDRNNELVIYNNDYMQYIKTGFNYDIKKKNRQEAGQWIGTALSLIGSVASFAFAGPVGVASGIALATTALAQLTSAVNNTAQAEATQQQKLMQLRQQKESVYNTDAVDLLDYYSSNVAKLMLYQVSDVLKKSLFDLFFYTGYLCGYRGIPNMTSRIRFNFVSCHLDFDYGNTNSKYITDEILEDISSKYSAGVTRIHHYDETWDLDQQYENWESFLFE